MKDGAKQNWQEKEKYSYLKTRFCLPMAARL
jgi:hypothetical protein